MRTRQRLPSRVVMAMADWAPFSGKQFALILLLTWALLAGLFVWW